MLVMSWRQRTVVISSFYYVLSYIIRTFDWFLCVRVSGNNKSVVACSTRATLWWHPDQIETEGADSIPTEGCNIYT